MKSTPGGGGEIGLMTAKIVLPHFGHEPASNSIVQTKPLQPSDQWLGHELPQKFITYFSAWKKPPKYLKIVYCKRWMVYFTHMRITYLKYSL
jgi:hypothetical protein